jgi:hypothetical protein
MVATVVMVSYLSTVRVQFLVSAISGSDDIYCNPVGIGIHVSDSTKFWRIPFGLQLVPTSLMDSATPTTTDVRDYMNATRHRT